MTDAPLPVGLTAALREQESQWATGRRVSVEDLLRDNPALAAVPGAILELAYSEAILRERHGLGVDLPDLQRRFPEVAAELAVQWQVDQAVVSRPTTATVTADPGATGPTAVPAHVGRYRVECVLGTGGMGVVYRARDPALGRTVALKMLKGAAAGNEAAVRFRTEAAAIARLHHPHIVQVFDVGECGGEPFFAMEFCAGGTLADRLASGPLPPTAAAAVLVQVARGVTAAHEQHILHRDLKPSNVLVGSGGWPSTLSGPTADGELPTVKVADFGLAKDLALEAGQTQTGAILGTPSYMPPEQAFGHLGDLRPAADVYALGAVLYECLTGRPPFRGATAADTLHQVRSEEPVPVRRLQPSVPRDLETICLKCLRKEPARRYPTAATLVEDLQRYQGGESILARPTGPVERGWRWARRNRLAAGMAAAVVLTLTTAAVGGSLLSVSLASALGDAKRDRDLAAGAERQTREHLAAAHAAAARLALQRGDGREAIRRLDEAAAAGLDTPALRFERVKALSAIHDVKRALDEIAPLASRDDLGERTGEVELWQADLLLDTGRVELADGLAQVRRALDRGLSSADRHYARGLLAATVPDALLEFQQAVRADPTNPRTNTVLAMLLVLSGRGPEAGEQLQAARLLFPEHPVFELIRATAAAVGEDPAAARVHLAALRAKVSNASFAVAAETVQFCDELARLCRNLERLQCGDPDVNKLMVGLSLIRALGRVQAATGRGSNDLYLPFPPGVVHAFRAAARDIPPGMSALLPGNQKALAETFERLAALQPDGFYFLMAGTQRAAPGAADWPAAAALLGKAAASPSFLPVRRMSLYGAAVAESTLYEDAAEPERARHRAKAMAYIRELAAGGLLPEQAFKIAGHCDRLDAPPEVAWAVVAAWERAAPQDPRLPLCQARVLLRCGAYDEVFRRADAALKVKDDPAWRTLRAEAEAGRMRRADGVK